MCYLQPGPRCSGHTRTNLRTAQANLVAAEADLQEKKVTLRSARNDEAREELRASRRAHEEALAHLKEAEDKYAVSKENRAMAMIAYRKAKSEYDATPEGINKNLALSKDPNLSPDNRKQANHAALEGALIRKEQIEALKAERERKEKEDEEQWKADEEMERMINTAENGVYMPRRGGSRRTGYGRYPKAKREYGEQFKRDRLVKKQAAFYETEEGKAHFAEKAAKAAIGHQKIADAYKRFNTQFGETNEYNLTAKITDTNIDAIPEFNPRVVSITGRVGNKVFEATIRNTRIRMTMEYLGHSYNISDDGGVVSELKMSEAMRDIVKRVEANKD